ncbi:hypothetical protein AAE478_001041 [Parahypoxylon ruwenzoriense]
MGNIADGALKDATDKGPIAPPYTEEASGSNSQPTDAPPDYHVVVATGAGRPSSPYRPFPPVMHARYQWKLTGTFHLCDEKPDDRLFAVSTHTGFSGELPRVMLHHGPSDKHPVLAAACEERPVGKIDKYSPNSVIQLPALVPNTDSEELVTEIMQAHTVGETGVGYEFSVEVGHGDKMTREKFEWRKTKKGSDGEFKEGGFKLLRLSSRHAQGSNSSNSGDATCSSNEAATEDGYEVVALFKWNKTLMNLVHPFELRFVGSALSGSLGERWGLMAVVTALRLWWLNAGFRANRKTAAVGEGGSYQA